MNAAPMMRPSPSKMARDCASVSSLTSMASFGLVGSVFFGLGAVTSLVLLVERLAGQRIADRPLLLLAVLLIALGVQLIGLGLVGEIIVHLRSPHRRADRVRERV